MGRFIKAMITDKSKQLDDRPMESHLLLMIAKRATRTGNHVKSLSPGQALVGDWTSFGLTRQNYRTALKNLEKWDFLTIKPTTKGTVVTIVGSEAYDLNIEECNHQTNQRVTISQPSSNHPANHYQEDKKDKKDKKERKEQLLAQFSVWWDAYDKKRGRGECEPVWLKLSDTERQSCLAHTPAYVRSTPDKSKRKDPIRYLRKRGFEDEILNDRHRISALDNFVIDEESGRTFGEATKQITEIRNVE